MAPLTCSSTFRRRIRRYSTGRVTTFWNSWSRRPFSPTARPRPHSGRGGGDLRTSSRSSAERHPPTLIRHSRAEPETNPCSGLKDFDQYYQEALERRGLADTGGGSSTTTDSDCSTYAGGDTSTNTDGGSSTYPGGGSSTYPGGGSWVMCNDGRTSNAGGKQGACSWHGGVSG